MLRRAVFLCLLALVLVGPAGAAPRELIPGLTYDRKIEFTARGPVVVNVLTAPRPGGLWSVKPVLSNETIVGTERLTAIEQRLSASATVAGVNGDLFTASGAPSGILMRGGALDQPPLAGRSSIGFDTAGNLAVARVTMLATWQGSGPRRALADVNGPPTRNGVSLLTPAYGAATPSTPGSVELTLGSFPPARPNAELTATVTAASANGGTPIPPGGAVLAARGTAATFMQREAPVGQLVKIRLILKPAWATTVDALGGGPLLVRNGKPVFRANEQFTPDQLLPRTARSAVGQLADGRILLVTVDADVVTSCINPPEPLVCEPLSRSTAVSAPGVSLPPPRVNAPGLSVDAPTLGQRSLAFARRVLTNMKADIEADYGDLPNGSSGEWWVNLVDRTLGNIGARVDAEAEAQYAHLPEGTARRRLAEFSAKIDAAIKKNAAGVVMFPYWLAGHALAFCDSEEFRAAEIDGFVTAVTHPIENIKQGIEEVRRDPYTPAVGALASAGIAAMQLRGAPETTAPAPERSNVFDINGPLRPLRLHNANIRTMVYELRRVIGETQPLRYLTKNEAWDLIYRGLYILTPEADVGELIYARLVHGYRGTEIEILFFDWGSDEHHTGRVYRLSPQNSRGLIAWLKRDRDRLESLWRKPKVIR